MFSSHLTSVAFRSQQVNDRSFENHSTATLADHHSDCQMLLFRPYQGFVVWDAYTQADGLG